MKTSSGKESTDLKFTEAGGMLSIYSSVCWVKKPVKVMHPAWELLQIALATCLCL